MTFEKKIVSGCAAVLFLGWLVLNFSRISGDQDAMIRMVLSTAFAVLILLRRKWAERLKQSESEEELSAGKDSNTSIWVASAAAAAVVGVILGLVGIIFGINQFEWIGLLLILSACLLWALPPAYSRDILFSMLLIYWLHPLPNQIFGPFQFLMQRLSVAGSEWLLHCLNVRVWADGMILCTGFRIFGIPEACSGMRTAVTVLLCGLGVGVLLQFRWPKLIVLIIAGLVQVLILNIIRISFMVMVAPKMPDEWAENFLHDSTGVFLLAAIFLINIEASLWAAYVIKRGNREKETTTIGRGDAAKQNVQTLGRHKFFRAKTLMLIVPILTITAVGVVGVVYKSRPYHRAMMIHSVIEQLAVSNPEHAEKASLAAVNLVPGDMTLFNQKIKVFLVREKFEEALIELKSIPKSKWEMVHTMLEAWTLMGLERPDDAIALIDALPEHTRRLPGVAMVRAEFAATRDDTKGVVDNIVRATNSLWMIRRVRLMFSYLASRQQWKTITDCDVSDVPYENLNHILIMLHAYMKTDRLWSMSRILEYGLKRWPNESRFLEYIASLAMLRPGSSWEDLFDEKLKEGLSRFNTNELSVYIENAFRLNRPDLAWMLYTRLKEIDPQDPSLHLTLAQFGHSWFTFRKHYVGILSMGKYDTVNLKSYYLKLRDWPSAALLDEVVDGSLTRKMSEYLKICVKELESREKAGKLTLRMQAIYPIALEKAGRHDDAEDKQWDFKVAASKDRDFLSLLNTINANVKMRKSVDAWNLLEPAMKKWPREYRLLEILGTLAVDNQGSVFEKFFAANLKSSIKTLDADELSVYIDQSFKMNRPDLAWLAYNRLKVVDPNDPSLYLAPVLFAYEWFLFRNTEAGLTAVSKAETVHLKTLYLKSMEWGTVPLAEQLGSEVSETAYYGHLEDCLKELKRREKEGKLSIRMQMMYPTTLGLMGVYDEAHARLDMIAEKYPDQKKEVLFRHALFYHREGKWEETYEALREYSALNSQPRLKMDLLKIDSLIHLNLGSYALYVADRAAETFQGTPEVYKTRAAIWATFDAPEQALFDIQHVDDYLKLPITTRLLLGTERYSEARYVVSVYGNEMPKYRKDNQAVLLPHAELAVTPHWEKPLDNKAMLLEAEEFAKESEKAFSPFIRDLARVKAQWFAKQGKGGSSDPSKWIAVGRDELEQGMALTELAMFLGRQQRYAEAKSVAEQALLLVPESVPLRRAMIGLSNGDLKVVEEARRVCPADPEIWLAYLVARFRKEGAGDWMDLEVEKVISEKSFSAGTITRAGDFMRREDLMKEAMKCAKHAVRTCRGLLPAYVLGLRCSLLLNDEKWAILCANQAAQNAHDPWPFIRIIGELELSRVDIRIDQESVFKKLSDKFPDEPKWAIRLSDIYLLKGEAKGALGTIESVIANRPENIDLRLLLLAAEAARRAGNVEKSVMILDRAYAMHPSNRMVLNNLIYSLSFNRKTIPRAIELLPKLFDLWGESFVAFDTAAVVYRNADNKEKAREYLRKAMNAVREIDSVWLQRNPTVVDIDAYLGDYDYALDEGLGSTRKEMRETSRRELYSVGSDLRKKIMKAAEGE